LPIHDKSSTLARPDAHQGVFHDRNNFGLRSSAQKLMKVTVLNDIISTYIRADSLRTPIASLMNQETLDDENFCKLLTPILKNNRGISGVERHRTPVTGILIVGLKLN